MTFGSIAVRICRVSNANLISEKKIIYRADFVQFFDNDQLYRENDEGELYSDIRWYNAYQPLAAPIPATRPPPAQSSKQHIQPNKRPNLLLFTYLFATQS